MPSENDAERAL